MRALLDRLALYLVKGFAVLLRSIPIESALAFGRVVGTLAFYLSSRRGVAYADMKSALGPVCSEKERWGIIRQHYAGLGMMLVEILCFPKKDLAFVEKFFSVDKPERILEAYRLDRGGIFLTAHFGNWEISQVIAKMYGKPFHVLANNQKFPKLNQFLNECREGLGTVVIRRGIEIRYLLRGLRQKKWTALLGDQDAGKRGGLILPFFGRKTTIPTGAFDFASRTGAVLLPVFTIRPEINKNRLMIRDPLTCRRNEPDDIAAAAKKYIAELETFIRQYPSQWLWETKRWKYSWTKRILILSDGKPGHLKQSQAIAGKFQEITSQYGREGMEYPTETLTVKFRSKFHRHLFPLTAFFLLPWIQGRLRWITPFFDKETGKRILEASTDFVISAGSALAALNLCLAKDSRAKSIVLMNPGFPFSLKRFDLAVVPAHDCGEVPKEALRTLLAPSAEDFEAAEKDAQKLKPFLKNPARIKIAVFLGGPTRSFVLPIEGIQKVMETLEHLAAGQGDYLVTTSRRTPDEMAVYLKEKVKTASGCQMLVIAKEDSRPEVSGGMMQLAEILIVTEDSISMISEAVRSGKRVIVLGFGRPGLPEKHKRFHQILSKEAAITLATPENLEEKIMERTAVLSRELVQRESEALRKRLQEIL